ncbi:MAG: hypothetical protein QOD83_1200 [Solirubrobacteraceae bacterium]|nr:hypothetical protein [Solirubrobacteraceae bacterium]
MRRCTAGVLVALLSAGLLAGCGGGEPKKQTKEQFIAEADAVCAGVADNLRRKGATDPKTPQDIAQANNVLADVYGDLAEGLSKIQLPGGADRAGAKAYVASVTRADPVLARLTSSGQALVDAVNASDARALTAAGNDVRAALDGFRKARADSDLLAVKYGFNVCGNLG